MILKHLIVQVNLDAFLIENVTEAGDNSFSFFKPKISQVHKPTIITILYHNGLKVEGGLGSSDIFTTVFHIVKPITSKHKIINHVVNERTRLVILSKILNVVLIIVISKEDALDDTFLYSNTCMFSSVLYQSHEKSKYERNHQLKKGFILAQF